MSPDKKDFYAKEVTGAIRKACEALNVPQERLEIEVVETGSTGIFGLIRRKAHIRVQVKTAVEEVVDEIFEVKEKVTGVKPSRKKEKEDIPRKKERHQAPVEEPAKIEAVAGPEKKSEEPPSFQEVSEESLELLKKELLNIVELMGFPSTVEIEAEGLSVNCVLSGEFEEKLAGPEGKTLDSLQYLLRKIVSRKVPERLKIAVDAGNFRQRRQEELKVRAVELAALVKKDGKTQVIPALNPSERRVIHMILQEDKEIRSRSVGDGLFKKILIYKPGKGNRSGRKRSSSRGGRRGRSSQSRKTGGDNS
ncbi:Jag family protein [Desulfomarina sp.]